MLDLHHANDLPGALLQLRQALKPDGLLLATLFAGETLIDLRRAWMEAELAEQGGASTRVSPFADPARPRRAVAARRLCAAGDRQRHDRGDLCRRACKLMRDLRAMGETNADRGAQPRASPAAPRWRARSRAMPRRHGADGRVMARFEIVTLTAWAPHESQQKPLRPGSAEARLADALSTTERPAGDKATP